MTSPADVTSRHPIIREEMLALPLPWLPVLMAPPTVTQSIAGEQSRVRPCSQRVRWSSASVTPGSQVTVRPGTSISVMASSRLLDIMTSSQCQRAFQDVLRPITRSLSRPARQRRTIPTTSSSDFGATIRSVWPKSVCPDQSVR